MSVKPKVLAAAATLNEVGDYAPSIPIPAAAPDNYDACNGGTFEASPQGRRLLHEFPDLVGGLALSELMVPVGKRVRHQERFGLVAIAKPDLRQTLDKARYFALLSNDILCTFEKVAGARHNREKPYLDTRQAIGLIRYHQPYDEEWDEGKTSWLIAVVGAGVDRDGNTLIKQIQDVTSVTKEQQPYEYLRTGLHNGFLWRDTLVQAWEQVAMAIGSPLVIVESGQNNFYAHKLADGSSAYDDVADRLHYLPNPATKNWEKPI